MKTTEHHFEPLEGPYDDGCAVPCVESNWFGRIPAPRNFSEYSAVLDYSTGEPYDEMTAWRGQADFRWRLDSGAVRRLIAGGGAGGAPRDMVADLKQYERALMSDALKAGGRWGLSEMSELEVFASLQHYGAATRLLDFTENAFVALWFACEELPEQAGLVYGVEALLSEKLGHEDSVVMRLDQILERARHRLVLWRPSYLNERMRAQQALFLFGNWEDRVWGSLPVPQRLGEAVTSDVLPILVTKELKQDMEKKWEVLFGFSNESLFPDLEGFSRAHGARRPFPWLYGLRDSS